METATHKYCNRAGFWMPLDQFSRDRTKPDGLESYCKQVKIAISRQWRQKHPKLHLLRAAKGRATRKGQLFTLTPADVVIPERCPLLGIPLVWNQWSRTGSGNALDNVPSLDRRDSSKGYTPDNVWVISWRANMLLSNATPDEILTLARNIHKM